MIDIEKILKTKYKIDAKEIVNAKNYRDNYGGDFLHYLVSIGALTDLDLLSIFSSQTGITILKLSDLTTYRLSHDLNLNEKLKACKALSLINDAGNNAIICCNPFDLNLNQLIQNIPQDDIYLISESDYQFFIDSNDNEINNSYEFDDENRLIELASEAPVVNLLNSLITKGVNLGASDMHIEPYDSKCRVRYRIDGVLHDADMVTQKLQLPLITRIKILSNMDIAEKRRPQDGKIELKVTGQPIDIRVSALPVNEGESVVLRFLRKSNIQYQISDMGLSVDVENMILRDIQKTSGVILITGPTGSGKTTTLYTLLNRLNKKDVKIITLEDPVEYQLQGINQVQVNSNIGFDFASGLRSIVRQDPDIIMLGEIRDKETAQIALQSALTGHLVFSTLHTNDAASAYTRLLDLGVEEFLINAALVSVVAQRLVRKLCDCAIVDEEASEKLSRLNLKKLYDGLAIETKPQLKMPIGCEKCSNTGYKGRVAITEYLECDDNIRSMSKTSTFITKAQAHNKQLGFRTLLEDGLYKARAGITSLEEVIRVAG